MPEHAQISRPTVLNVRYVLNIKASCVVAYFHYGKSKKWKGERYESIIACILIHRIVILRMQHRWCPTTSNGFMIFSYLIPKPYGQEKQHHMTITYPVFNLLPECLHLLLGTYWQWMHLEQNDRSPGKEVFLQQVLADVTEFHIFQRTCLHSSNTHWGKWDAALCHAKEAKKQSVTANLGTHVLPQYRMYYVTYQDMFFHKRMLCFEHNCRKNKFNKYIPSTQRE